MQQVKRFVAVIVILLAVLSLSAWHSFAVAGDLPAATSSLEENKAVARRFMEDLYNDEDLTVADEIIAPDYVEHYAGGSERLGTEGLVECVTFWRTAFPGLQFTIEDSIAEGDRVVVRWTARGTHKGEYMGISPTGNQVTFSGITTFRIAEGKVQEAWWHLDDLGLLEQLGVVWHQVGGTR